MNPHVSYKQKEPSGTQPKRENLTKDNVYTCLNKDQENKAISSF